MKAMSEWNRYACTIPKSEGSRADGRSLSTVYHVAHLPEARRILEDGRLRAGLVSDESKLKRSRTCVTWLSANTWAYGSIYGNVEFAFDWTKIIENRQVYWVEAMPNYRPAAYRFLLTDRDMSGSKYVVPYDPEKDKGPLRKREDKWYWNGEYTSEFMLEDDVSLRDCTNISTISHHQRSCALNDQGCRYKGTHSSEMAGRVLAFLLASNLHTVDHALFKNKEDGTMSSTFEIRSESMGIWGALGGRHEEHFCDGLKNPASGQSVLRGALALYGAEQDQAAKALISLLHDPEDLEQALIEIIEEHFGIDGYHLP